MTKQRGESGTGDLEEYGKGRDDAAGPLASLGAGLAKAFPSMPEARQIGVFRNSEPRVRMKLLELSRIPIRLVRSLAMEDFYWSAKALDREERSFLIHYASTEQITFFSDLEIWKGCRIEPDRFLALLKEIADGGINRLSAWLKRADQELLVSAFQKVITVQTHTEMFNPEDEYDSMAPYTLDGLHFIAFKRRESRPIVEMCLKLLMDDAKNKYFELMNDLLWRAPGESELEAFEARQRRLTDHGFPDPEDLMAVYAPMSEEQVVRCRKDAFREDDPPSPAHVLRRFAQTDLYLHELTRHASLKGVTGLSELGAQLAHLANKILFASGLAPDAKDLALAAGRAERYVSIGLEVISGGRLDEGVRALMSFWLEHLFKLGYGRALEIKARAHHLVQRGWFAKVEGWRQFVGSPEADIVEALLALHPMHFDEHSQVRRDFCSLAEVEQAGAAVARVEQMGTLLLRITGVEPSLVQHALETGHPLLSGRGLLLTVLADAALGGKGELRPIRAEQAARLYAMFTDERGDLREPVVEDAVAALAAACGGTDAQDANLCAALVKQGFQAFAEEMRSIDLTGPMEPKAVSSLWMKG